MNTYSDVAERQKAFDSLHSNANVLAKRALEGVDPSIVNLMRSAVPVGVDQSDSPNVVYPEGYSLFDGPAILMIQPRDGVVSTRRAFTGAVRKLGPRQPVAANRFDYFDVSTQDIAAVESFSYPVETTTLPSETYRLAAVLAINGSAVAPQDAVHILARGATLWKQDSGQKYSAEYNVQNDVTKVKAAMAVNHKIAANLQQGKPLTEARSIVERYAAHSAYSTVISAIRASLASQAKPGMAGTPNLAAEAAMADSLAQLYGAPNGVPTATEIKAYQDLRFVAPTAAFAL